MINELVEGLPAVFFNLVGNGVREGFGGGGVRAGGVAGDVSFGKFYLVN